MNSIERVVNYKFKRQEYALEAMTHCSWPHSEPPCYQRLEYLGDAVLDFLVTRYYFHMYGQTDQGEMTLLRSATVNNEKLALSAVRLELQRYLLHFSPYLQKHIVEYVNQVFTYIYT